MERYSNIKYLDHKLRLYNKKVKQAYNRIMEKTGLTNRMQVNSYIRTHKNKDSDIIERYKKKSKVVKQILKELRNDTTVSNN